MNDPEVLVNPGTPGPKPGRWSCNDTGDCDQVFSYPMYRDLERGQKVLTGLAAHRTFQANLALQGQTESGTAMVVSGSYFPVLGLNPALGRLLSPSDDDASGAHAVAVLSHAFWRTRLGSDPGVLNQTLVTNGHPITVVGVGPRGFRGDEGEEIYGRYGVRRSRWGLLNSTVLPSFYVDWVRAMRYGFWGGADWRMHTMPADFLVDPGGGVVLAHYGRDIGDHLSLAAIGDVLGGG